MGNKKAPVNLAELKIMPMPANVYSVIYEQCGGFVDSDADAVAIWRACRNAVIKEIEDRTK